MSKILVSIIIPTYNRASLIEETLQSILNQTITNWECIIVDDGSIDNTKQIIKDYELQDSRFKYFKRPKNSPKGANSCRNFGFKKSKGKYVNWFDSDDIMHSKKLELQVKQLEKDESVPFTVCQTYLFKESIKNTLGLRKEKIYSKNFFEDFITNKIKWLTQAPLIRKDFLIKNNLFFDENLQRSQEREFFIRVLNLVENYNVDNTPLVYFRIHENSISFGKINEDKLKSSFIVNYNILKNYKNRISENTRNILISYLKESHLQAIKYNYQELQKDFYKKIQQNLNSKFLKIKFFIANLLITKTKRGYFIYK